MTGETEVALPDVTFVDAHHHLLDGPETTYSAQHYADDVAGSGRRIVASVYAEMMTRARPDGPEHLRFLGEVAHANDVAEASAGSACEIAAAILGRVDLTAPRDAAEALDAALELAPGRFRGIRELIVGIPAGSVVTTGRPARPELLADPGFRRGFAELASRGLVFDIGASGGQLDAVRDLAEVFPEAVIVINHLAPFSARSDAEHAELEPRWRTALQNLAQAPNVRCKIGGLGMRAWWFNHGVPARSRATLELADTWRPYVQAGIEAFGAERCMLESNYPTDAGAGTFADVWDALARCISEGSDDEIAALAHRTAVETYGLRAQTSPHEQSNTDS